jgi:DNA-binding MarR family transcriptional regulator
MTSGHLQRELKKKRPFESPEQEAMLNILRTNDQFQNRFGRLFREYGLTSSQYNVLRILRGEGKPMPCLEVADRMVQVVPAITGLIDRLEMQGLVSRERCTEDRRVVLHRDHREGVGTAQQFGRTRKPAPQAVDRPPDTPGTGDPEPPSGKSSDKCQRKVKP